MVVWKAYRFYKEAQYERVSSSVKNDQKWRGASAYETLLGTSPPLPLTAAPRNLGLRLLISCCLPRAEAFSLKEIITDLIRNFAGEIYSTFYKLLVSIADLLNEKVAPVRDLQSSSVNVEINDFQTSKFITDVFCVKKKTDQIFR